MSNLPSRKVLAILPSLIPSTIISIIRPLTYLCYKKQIQLRIEMETNLRPDCREWPDIVILCRNTSPTLNPYLDTWYEKRIPIIYDIDDNFFNIPLNSSDFARTIRQEPHQRTLSRIIKQASLVRVYSHPLREHISSITPLVEMVRPPLDWELIKPIRKPDSQSAVKIVYATSRTKEDELAEIFLPALRRIMDGHKSTVSIYFLGSNPLKELDDKRIHFQPFRLNYKTYLEKFSSAGYDIGLAPLRDDVFHRSKTNVKYREYGASRIAGIYSDVDVYSDWIKNGENGLLVKNTEESWFQALEKLIVDKDLRNRIQENAYKDVRKNFSQEQFIKKWFEQIQQVLCHGEMGDISEIWAEEKSNISLLPIPETIKFSIWKRALQIFRENGYREGISRAKNWLYVKTYMILLQIRLSSLKNR